MLGVASSIQACHRQISVRSGSVAYQQVRLAHRTMPKPRPRVKISSEGDLSINTDRLVKIHRWKPEKITAMMQFVHRSFEDVKHLPEGERMPSLQGMLDGYIGAMWGAQLARLRFKAKRNRRIRLKKRADTKLARKLAMWNAREDDKEFKVQRDAARALRSERGEQFSFKKFVKEYREARRKPLVIQDEATFEKYLEEQKQKMYFNGPAIVRQPMSKKAGYRRRFTVEITAPIVYELKRKAYITMLVKQREDAIKAKKVLEEQEARRLSRQAAAAEKAAARRAYWEKVQADWHTENDRLIALKREYFMAREQVYAEARKEFLAAMNADVHLWEESPDECKFLRFKFGEGVSFPFNNTRYL